MTSKTSTKRSEWSHAPFVPGLLLCLLLTGCAHRAAPPPAPPLSPMRLLEPGVLECEVALPRGDGGAGELWIYLPQRPAGTKIPCLFIAPAGTRLFHGIGLADGDRPEHLPYVHAGYAVVAYGLDGPLPDHPTDQQVVDAARAFRDADAGVDDAHAAIDYALARLPQADPHRLYTAGHSSAGTVSLLVAEHDPRIAACIAYAPTADVPARLGPSVMQALGEAVPGDDTFLTRNSPDADAAGLHCPLFLFHADDDDNTPLSDNQAFADQVRLTNRDVDFVRVPSGGHYDSMIEQGIPAAIRWLKAQPAPR